MKCTTKKPTIMAYLDDHKHLHHLCLRYGAHTAPLEELREAWEMDGMLWNEEWSYPDLPDLSVFSAFKLKIKNEEEFDPSIIPSALNTRKQQKKVKETRPYNPAAPSISYIFESIQRSRGSGDEKEV